MSPTISRMYMWHVSSYRAHSSNSVMMQLYTDNNASCCSGQLIHAASTSMHTMITSMNVLHALGNIPRKGVEYILASTVQLQLHSAWPLSSSWTCEVAVELPQVCPRLNAAGVDRLRRGQTSRLYPFVEVRSASQKQIALTEGAHTHTHTHTHTQARANYRADKGRFCSSSPPPPLIPQHFAHKVTCP